MDFMAPLKDPMTTNTQMRYSLVYGLEAVTPTEMEVPTIRTEWFLKMEDLNDEMLCENTHMI